MYIINTSGLTDEGTSESRQYKSLPMRTWFTALYLLAVSSKGLSSVALGRHLGIGQKTAWFLGHRIRAMMADDTGLLRGIVEANQTYVGGKRKRGQKSSRDGDGWNHRGHDARLAAMLTRCVGRVSWKALTA
jgi:hypothetical protein